MLSTNRGVRGKVGTATVTTTGDFSGRSPWGSKGGSKGERGVTKGSIESGMAD